MKKYFLFGFLLAIVSIMATGCSSCQSENNKQDNAPAQEQVTNFNADYDGVVPDLTEGAEHVIALQRHAAHTGSQTAHHSHVGLVEAHCLTITTGKYQLVVSVGEHYVNHIVILPDVDGTYAE